MKKRSKITQVERSHRRKALILILIALTFVIGVCIGSCGKEGEEVDNSPPDSETQVVYKL